MADSHNKDGFSIDPDRAKQYRPASEWVSPEDGFASALNTGRIDFSGETAVSTRPPQGGASKIAMVTRGSMKVSAKEQLATSLSKEAATPSTPEVPVTTEEDIDAHVGEVSFQSSSVDAEVTSAPELPSEEQPEVVKESPKSATRAKGSLFIDDQISPIVYDIVLRKAFSPEWVFGDEDDPPWLPETLWSEINKVFGVDPSRLAKDKILSLQVMLNTDNFWTDVHVFENIVLVFNNQKPLFDRIQHCTPEQLCWGVKLAGYISNKEKYNYDPAAYIAASFFEDNIWWLPDEVRFAQPFLNELAKREKILDFKPKVIEDAYRKVEGLPTDMIQLEETMVGIQVAKLIVIRDYTRSREAELHKQLLVETEK